MKIRRSVLEPETISCISRKEDSNSINSLPTASCNQELCANKSQTNLASFVNRRFSRGGVSVPVCLREGVGELIPSDGSVCFIDRTASVELVSHQNSGQRGNFNTEKMRPSLVAGMLQALPIPSITQRQEQATKQEGSTIARSPDCSPSLDGGSSPQFNLHQLTTPLGTGQVNSLGSCQLSPRSDSSFMNFQMFSHNRNSSSPSLTSGLAHLANTPPASDMEESGGVVSNLKPSFSPTYYSMSPPAVLSPPMSNNSHSESCDSPSNTLSSLSPPQNSRSPHNFCSYSSNEEPMFMQSYSSSEQSSGQSPMSITPKNEEHNLKFYEDPNNNPAATYNQSEYNQCVTKTIIKVSSSVQDVKEEPVCSNCSHTFCSCTQLKTFSLPHSDYSCQQENKSITEGHNLRDLMFEPADVNKNIKQLVQQETEEAISNATETEDAGERIEGKEGKLDEEPLSEAGVGKVGSIIQPSPLPPDIPTLASLSIASPKLSTWRQTRIISEKLEQHLWTWRCACKKSGKRISKSLLQARAKWAFRKAGIVEFKASDGWYWKWLSKWRRKGEEIGITELGEMSSMEIQVLPSTSQSQSIKTEIKEEDLRSGRDSPSSTIAAKLESSAKPPGVTQDSLTVTCTDCHCRPQTPREKTSPIFIKEDPDSVTEKSEEHFSRRGEDSNRNFSKVKDLHCPDEEYNHPDNLRKRTLSNEGCNLPESSSATEAKLSRKCPSLERRKPESSDEEGEWEGEQWGQTWHKDDCCFDLGLSFIPLDHTDLPSPEPGSFTSQMIPNQKVAVTDILPFTLSGNQVCLAPDPTNSNLPISPIFIKTSGMEDISREACRTKRELQQPFPSVARETRESGESVSFLGSPSGSLPMDKGAEKEPFVMEYGNNAALLDNLEEITSLPNEFLNLESLSHWQPGEMEEIDADQLVSELCSSPPSASENMKQESSEESLAPETDSQPSPSDVPSSMKHSFTSPLDSPSSKSDSFNTHSNISFTKSSRLPSYIGKLQQLPDSLICRSGSMHSHSSSLSLLAGNAPPHSGQSQLSQIKKYSIGCENHRNLRISRDQEDMEKTNCGSDQKNSSQGTPTTDPQSLLSNGSVQIDSEHHQHLIQPCGHNCRRFRQESKDTEDRVDHARDDDWRSVNDKTVINKEETQPVLGPVTTPTGNKQQQMTVIAIHKKRGEESLNKFKEEVRKFAVDHTFKETAKRFGIHHSTVSGWVKESEKQDKCANFGDFFREKGDDKFILWLRECRETGVQVTLGMVKSKVSEILASCSQQDVEKTCKWFLLWHNRREEKLYVEGMEDEDMKKETQNLAYPPAFKLEVALFAKKHSQYAAAKIFNVARRRIFDWMRQIPKLEELIAKGHMKKMTGRGPKNRDIDQALYAWYCERKAAGNRPKSCNVQSKARELYLTYGYNDMKCSYGWFKRWSQRFQIQLRYSYDDEIIEWIMSRFDANLPVNAADLQNYGLSLIKKEDPSFKASSGWALRFCKRHKEFMTIDGSFSCKLPPHLENRVATFRSVLAQLHKEKQFPAYTVGAMDELCLHLWQPSERRGLPSPSCSNSSLSTSSTLLRHLGMESCQATIILSATADGNLLPPFVIFKVKTDSMEDSKDQPKVKQEASCESADHDIKANETNPEDGKRRLQLLQLGMTSGLVGDCDPCEAPGSVGELEMGAWLEQVWFKHVPQSNFLLADSFPVHTCQTTQKLLLERDSCLAIIPNACSAKLQPLHQGIKEKFKRGIEEKYLTWHQQFGGLPGEKLDPRTPARPPHPQNILAWVDQVFQELRQNKHEIAESFRKTEIFCRASDK